MNPAYPTAHHWYGLHYLAATGRLDEAIAEGRGAQQLDPLSLITNTELGVAYILARQYDNAVEQLRKALEMDQGFYYAHWRLGTAYVMKGSFQDAISEYQRGETAQRRSAGAGAARARLRRFGQAGRGAQDAGPVEGDFRAPSRLGVQLGARPCGTRRA